MQAPRSVYFTFVLLSMLATAAFALALSSAPVKAAPGIAPPAVVAAQETPIAPNEATTITAQINAALLADLPFADQQDFEDAQRGFIATLPEVTIKAENGYTVWTLQGYEFLAQEEAPPSINPSLWRMAQLNMNNGLFEVTDRIYQVRGFDLSNMTIVEGDSGVILIDPLSTAETARAALDLYYQERGEKPVVAVIYTHSHVDHYAGVKGVITEEDVAAGNVAVLAPEGFMEAAVSENVFAGNAMNRRFSYQYGILIPRGEFGQVDNGLGKVNPLGAITLIAPTDLIAETGETRTIDGIELEFMIVSGTEAPAEMTIYFPQFNALDSAEIACPLLHNILTLRGAQVRDAKLWATSLDNAIARYGDSLDVVFAQHNWPRWGQENVITYLANQRDLYEYLNDQTLRLLNHGYTGIEIAEMLELPESLNQQWYTHGYYGTVSHNVKAIYQRYIGWYDGNPANLHALPPEAAGAKFVEYMGGADAVIERARADYAKGDYRWVAQVLSQVVFADPENEEARLLEADALEQLGYQAEGLWRNWYLMGAYELRNGINTPPGTGGSASPDTLKAMSIPLFFDFWGVRLNAEKADGVQMVINWIFTDTEEQYALNLSNSALTYRSDYLAPEADLTVTLERSALDAITLGESTFEDEVAAGAIELDGDSDKLAELLAMFDTFSPEFPVVTP
ncbi:MAG: MBL fold metallo-hydrolase [Caldilineaceae bacterium]|nr:MBL fold metallo-hydrolase [Caldilineaceae bacterium]